MKKQLVIIGIVALLVCVEFSGCNQISNTLNPEKSRFVGTWVSSDNVSLDLFSDGTCAFAIMSGTWDLKDGKFVIDLPSSTVPLTSTWNYVFSNNDRTLTLIPTSSTTGAGMVLQKHDGTQEQNNPPPKENNNTSFNNTEKVQLLSYNVITYGRSSQKSHDNIKLGDGFVHNSTYPFTYYSVQGTIKNIAGYTLNSVIITISFYDKNDTLLQSETYTVTNLANSSTANFGVSFESEHSNFDKADKVGFEFAVS